MPEKCPLFGVSVIQRFLRYSIIGKAVGTSRTVRYTVGVRYSECPLKEVPLYVLNPNEYLRIKTFLSVNTDT